MSQPPATLLELSIAEQEARHCAAITALRDRAADIGELQRLCAEITTRGYRARPIVRITHLPVTTCDLTLCVTCTRAEFAALPAWLIAAAIAIAHVVATRATAPDERVADGV